MRVRIVAAVAEQSPRPSRGRLSLPRTGGIASTRSTIGTTSGTFAAVVVAVRGTPWASVITWCLLPFFRRSTGLGPVSAASAAGPDEAAVDDRPAPVDLAGPLQLGQQDLVELGPDAGHRPVAQAAPAGHTGAATHLDRKVLPVDSGLEDEQDAGQSLPVHDGWAGRGGRVAWAWAEAEGGDEGAPRGRR